MSGGDPDNMGGSLKEGGTGTLHVGFPEALCLPLPSCHLPCPGIWDKKQVTCDPHSPLLKRTEVFKQSLLLFSFRKDREEARAHLPCPPHPSAPGPSLLSNTPWGPWSPVWGYFMASALSICLSPKAPCKSSSLHLFELVPLSALPCPSQPWACKAIPFGQPAG